MSRNRGYRGGLLVDEDEAEHTPGRVNKVAYFCLAFFLGGLGAHKFYAGKTGMGILYLVFSWTFIPGIVGVIEGLMALGKPSDCWGDIIA